MQILTLFSDSPILHVSEIAEKMGQPRSTAYRYVAALKANHLIEEIEEGSGYRLGPKILELAASMTRRPLRDVAKPYLAHIGRETGETVILHGLRDQVGVCLEKVDGNQTLRVSFDRGEASPLHASATGKAIFAYLNLKEQKKIIQSIGLDRFTLTTLTEWRLLKAECERIRGQGYAESEGELIEGTRGIAAPIFSFSGRVVASIGVSVPTHRGDGDDRLLLIRLLTEAAEQITQELSSQEAEPTTIKRFRRRHQA